MAGLGLAAMMAAPMGSPLHSGGVILAAAGLFGATVTLLPVLNGDGYLMLVEVLRLPNLRRSSWGLGGGKDGDLSPTSHEPSSPAGSSSAAAIQQRFDWAGSSSEEHMPKLLDAHGNVTPSLTLSPFVLRQLAGAVPSRFAFADWRLLYSTAVHGISLNTLYTKCSACGCCVLAIKDDEGNVFGGFCTVCMAGHTFGKILSPLGMPSITLFIFFGLVRHTAIRTPETPPWPDHRSRPRSTWMHSRGRSRRGRSPEADRPVVGSRGSRRRSIGSRAGCRR